jgi:4-phytase/acid phosphatase
MHRMIVTTAAVWLATLAHAQPAGPVEELKYAVIVTRHGVRSPTWTLDRLNQYSASPWPDWKVPSGNLTTNGRLLMKIMGAYYHAYFSELGLLGKPSCQDAARVHFWADTDQRTLETAKALSEGILPGCQAEIHSVTGKSDALFDPIESGIATPDPKLALAAVRGRIGLKLDAMLGAHQPALDELTRILNGTGKAARSVFDEPIAITANEHAVDMTGPLRLASTLTENLLLEYADGMSGDRLGWGRLNASNLQQIMSLHTAYADLMRRTPYLARARGSNLLSHVLRSLEQAAAGKSVRGAIGEPQNALLVISGHDTNISNLSGMLGLSWLLPSYQQDDSPPGGALIFSLWHSPSSGRDSVRLQFIAQTLDQMHRAVPLSLKNPPARANLFIPGCSTSAEGYACDWASFRATAAASIVAAFVN